MNQDKAFDVEKYSDAPELQTVPKETVVARLSELERTVEAIKTLKNSRAYKRFVSSVLQPELNRCMKILTDDLSVEMLHRAQGGVAELNLVMDLDTLDRQMSELIHRTKKSMNDLYGTDGK